MLKSDTQFHKMPNTIGFDRIKYIEHVQSSKRTDISIVSMTAHMETGQTEKWPDEAAQSQYMQLTHMKIHLVRL